MDPREEFGRGWRAPLPAITPKPATPDAESEGETSGGDGRESFETHFNWTNTNLDWTDTDLDWANTDLDWTNKGLTIKERAMKKAMSVYLSDDWNPDDIDWLSENEAPPPLDIDLSIWPEVSRILRNISGYTKREREQEVEAASRCDGTPGPAGIYENVGLKCGLQHEILRSAFKTNTIRSTTVKRIKSVSFGRLAVREFFIDEEEMCWRKVDWDLVYYECDGQRMRDFSQRDLFWLKKGPNNSSSGRLIDRDIDDELSDVPQNTGIPSRLESNSYTEQERRVPSPTQPEGEGKNLTDRTIENKEETIICIPPRKAPNNLDLGSFRNGNRPQQYTQNHRANSDTFERCSSEARGFYRKDCENKPNRRSLENVLQRPRTGIVDKLEAKPSRNRSICRVNERRAQISATRLPKIEVDSHPQVCIKRKDTSDDTSTTKNNQRAEDIVKHSSSDNLSLISDSSLDAMIKDILCDDIPARKQRNRKSSWSSASPEVDILKIEHDESDQKLTEKSNSANSYIDMTDENWRHEDKKTSSVSPDGGGAVNGSNGSFGVCLKESEAKLSRNKFEPQRCRTLGASQWERLSTKGEIARARPKTRRVLENTKRSEPAVSGNQHPRQCHTSPTYNGRTSHENLLHGEERRTGQHGTDNSLRQSESHVCAGAKFYRFARRKFDNLRQKLSSLSCFKAMD